MGGWIRSWRARRGLRRLRALGPVAREELAVAAPAKAWPVLERWGMCLIPGFEDAERCLAVGRETQGFLEQVYAAAAASGAPGGSHAGCHWQRGPGRYQSYSELAAADRPVVNIRGREADGIDLGMIDAFGLGRSDAVPALRELVDAVEPRLAAALPGVRELMATNVYYSRDLVKPRGPHVDSLKPAYKAFLYLSDARRMAVGPYCYLGGLPSPRCRQRSGDRRPARAGCVASDGPADRSGPCQRARRRRRRRTAEQPERHPLRRASGAGRAAPGAGLPVAPGWGADVTTLAFGSLCAFCACLSAAQRFDVDVRCGDAFQLIECLGRRGGDIGEVG